MFQQPNNPKRQQLIPDQPQELVKSTRSFKAAAAEEITYDSEAFKETLKKLREQVQIAIELEHSTIPPYLCALYSIEGGTNLVAADIIKSVVLEEMLHLIMAANLMNAIGGTPKIGDGETGNDGKFIPSYPTGLPGGIDPSLHVGLKYFCRNAIETFIQIEHPAKEVEPSDIKANVEYPTIGVFYRKLEANLEKLEASARRAGKTIFTGDPKRQVSADNYYGAGGKLFTVENLADAKNVINEIVGQGEGDLGSIFAQPYKNHEKRYLLFGPGIDEYAHYFRFKEIQYGCFYAPTDSAHRDAPNNGLPTGKKIDVDWSAAYKMRPNPKMEDYKNDPELYQKSLEFNKTYSKLLDNICAACNGKPEVLKDGIILMYELRNKAIELMMIPVGDKDEQTAGPSFEYVKA